MTASVDPLSPTARAVYRLFNRMGVLLYVGSANDPRTRWRQHAGDKIWWHEVYRKEVVWYETAERANTVETRAITDEWPVYNRLGVPVNELKISNEDAAQVWIAELKSEGRVTLRLLTSLTREMSRLESIKHPELAHYRVHPDIIKIVQQWAYDNAGRWTYYWFWKWLDNWHNAAIGYIISAEVESEDEGDAKERVDAARRVADGKHTKANVNLEIPETIEPVRVVRSALVAHLELIFRDHDRLHSERICKELMALEPDGFYKDWTPITLANALPDWLETRQVSISGVNRKGLTKKWVLEGNVDKCHTCGHATRRK